MNKAKELFKIVGLSLKKNSPTILTGLGIAGFFSSVVMAVKATPKAILLIDQEVFSRWQDEDPGRKYEDIQIWIANSEEQGYDMTLRLNSLTIKEKITVAWEPYLPSAGVALLSATMIIMANHISTRRTAALASLYSIAETTLREYQEKVTETVGKKKAALIKGDLDQKKLDDNPLDEEEIIYSRDGGDTLCYESLSGRYFYSTIEAIRRAENRYNQSLLSDQLKTLNELYYEFGLEGTELGDKAGWDISNGMVELEFSAKIAKGDVPCVVISCKNMPQALWF